MLFFLGFFLGFFLRFFLGFFLGLLCFFSGFFPAAAAISARASPLDRTSPIAGPVRFSRAGGFGRKGHEMLSSPSPS